MTAAAIILAAGGSTRMGEPKPLLPWGDSTLLAWELRELMRSSVDEIVVITGASADDVRRSLGDAGHHCVFNPRWSQGRATSLACGARTLAAPGRPGLDALAILNVDQPTRHDIVDRLLEALRAAGPGVEAVQPSYRGQAGHPVVLRGTLLPEVAAVREETLGLRGLLESHPARLVTMDDEPLVRLDMDTPDAVEEGRRLLGVAG